MFETILQTFVSVENPPDLLVLVPTIVLPGVYGIFSWEVLWSPWVGPLFELFSGLTPRNPSYRLVRSYLLCSRLEPFGSYLSTTVSKPGYSRNSSSLVCRHLTHPVEKLSIRYIDTVLTVTHTWRVCYVKREETSHCHSDWGNLTYSGVSPTSSSVTLRVIIPVISPEPSDESFFIPFCSHLHLGWTLYSVCTICRFDFICFRISLQRNTCKEIHMS